MPETNREFALNNEAFRTHCGESGIRPTRRQASRYRRKIGAAYRKVKIANPGTKGTGASK